MSENVVRDLGDGLALRRATVRDTEGLVAFHADIHRDPGMEEPEQYVAAWVRDLMERPHPTFQPSDFTIVEHSATGEIVSSLCLISQTWAYEGIEFGVGRPELVGTRPDYRRRGLVRAQMELIHQWSAERGERLQAITGIPYYYRQFGYEMTMTLGGGRGGSGSSVPKLKEGEAEPYRLRLAKEEDLGLIAQVYREGAARWPVVCVRDAALWRHELNGMSDKNVNRRDLCIIETAEGEPVGFVNRSPRLWRGRVGIGAYELTPGVSWLDVTPSVMRHLWSHGEALAAGDPEQTMETFGFWLGTEHPALELFKRRLPQILKPYAWYLRVPDLAGFLQLVSPALEERLAASLLSGHTGELKISFYQGGLWLRFEAGRVTGVEPWQPTREAEGEAGFPGLTFLQLVFGYRTVQELQDAFPDCWTANDGAQVLLDVLFPQQASDVWPIS
ncbi:MAG: GNAT family N-acetyltransferase [Anaerolineae bacterium]|nr:GNAT family N-acetyltransferase [Anaerolineae bacterium]